jgi:hypothetical protein
MNEFLRHAVATIAYRGGKAIRDVPVGFADFRASETSRTPVQILAHIGDLLEWSCVLARGDKTWNNAAPQLWEGETARFFSLLKKLDTELADRELQCDANRLFQGPIADALTHIGQIAMLRRIAGAPMPGENYFRAEMR